MNEQIERMARVAGADISEPLWDGDTFISIEFSPAELAHFAALVAEECAKQCELLGSVSDGDLRYAVGTTSSARLIRTKFPMPGGEDAQ